MKITKEYLRSVIKEEMEKITETPLSPPPPRRDTSVRDGLLRQLKPNQKRAYTFVTQGVDYIKKSAKKNMPKEGEVKKQVQRILDICLNISNDIALDPTNPQNITNIKNISAMFDPRYKTGYNDFFTEWHKLPFVISLTTGGVNVYALFREAEKLLKT